MKQHSISYFALRTLLAALPVILFMGTYAVLDPFKVIHRYNEPEAAIGATVMGSNQGFKTIKCLERNLEAGRTYDSFILGSSMSQTYRIDHWKQYLPQGASPFHLDTSSETLQGMADKLQYLSDKGIRVKNALIIIEEAMLHREPNDNDFLYARPPGTTSQVNWLQFQLLFFNIYKNPAFVKYSLWPDRYRNYMLRKHYVAVSEQSHNDVTNENLYTRFDSIIAADAATYYTPERVNKNFYTPPPGIDPPGINDRIERSLAQLAQLLKAHGTNYIVIVPPRYNRQLLHPHDMAMLCQYLGRDKVRDLSHHPYTTDPTAYYDWAAHLTAARCDTLLIEAMSPIHPQ